MIPFLEQLVAEVKKRGSGLLGQVVPETISDDLRGSQSPILGQAAPELPLGNVQTSAVVRNQLLTLLASVPWGQNLLTLKKVSDPAARVRIPFSVTLHEA